MALKILFIVAEYYPATAGGAEHQARLQAEELVARGHDVTVVLPNYARLPSRDINGVHVIRTWLGPRPRRTLHDTRFLLYLLRTVRSYDVVHVHHNRPGQLGLLAGLLMHRRVFYKITSAPGPEGRFATARTGLTSFLPEYWYLFAAARVQALAPFVAAHLLAGGVRKSAIRSIPNGLDSHSFFPAAGPEAKRAARIRADLPPDSFLFLFAGRLVQSKGVEELLAAWRSLAVEPAPGLVLAGAAANSRMGPIETLPGLTIRNWTDNIVDYYQAADVFVLPSFREGMSNAVLEAMACGLPVIVSPAGAADGLVQDGVNGLVVPAGNVPALRQAMLKLIHNPELRQRLGAAAAETAASYSITSVVSQIEEQYIAMIAERRHPPWARILGAP